MKNPRRHSTTKGFTRAASLMQSRIRKAGEGRGFAATRLLTHWAEVVGAQTAATCRPVEVTYGKGGLGATLTLLTTGAQAPMLEMQKEQIREKVNACYGWNAISRIRLTQTAATGFAEGQAQFTAAPTPEKSRPSEAILARAAAETDDIENEELRRALASLASNLYSKTRT